MMIMESNSRSSHPAAVAALLSTLLFTATLFGWPEDMARASAQEPKSGPKTLRAIILRDFPPTYLQDHKTGRAMGLAVEVLTKMAERERLVVTFAFADSWAEMIEKVSRGDADVIPGLTPTEEREKVLLFGGLIDTAPLTTFLRSQDTSTGLRSGMKVGATRGSVSLEYMKKIQGIQVKIYEEYPTAILDLLTSRIDALAGNAEAIWYLAREAGLDDRIKTVGKPFGMARHTIAVNRDNAPLLQQLTGALENFVATPEYREIYLRWHEKPKPYWTPLRIVLAMTALACLSVLAMAAWRYRSLRRLNRALVENLRERERIESALRESESRFKTLAEASFEGVALTERGKLLDVNNQLTDMLGYERGELVGTMVSEIIAPEYRDVVKEAEAASLLEPYENAIIRKDGTRVYVETLARTVQIEGKKVRLTAIRDITERKMKEDQLHIQHQLAQGLSSVTDLEEGLRLCVRAAIQATGLDSGGFYVVDRETGALDFFASQGLSPDFIRAVSHYEADSDHTRLVLAGKPVYAVFDKMGLALPEAERREGLRFLAVIPMTHEGRVIGCLNVASHRVDDLSPACRKVLETVALGAAHAIARLRAEASLRDSEVRLRTIFRTSPMPIVTTRLVDGHYTEVNKAFEKLTGYTAAEVIGHPQTDLDIWVDPDRRRQLLDEVRVRGSVSNFEFQLRSKSGECHDLLMSAELIELQDQPHLLTVGWDITMRKRAEDALRKSEAATRRLAEVNAIMAEIGQIISSTLNIDEIYALFSEKVKHLLPYDRIVVNLISGDGTTLINRYVGGDPVRERNFEDAFPIAGTMTEAMLLSRESLIIDGQDEDELAAEYAGLLPEFKAGFRSFLSVPLISGHRVIGGLHFRSKEIGLYSEKDLRLGQSIANQIAGAVANSELFAEHKRAEEALRESEERIRLVVENIEEVFWMADPTISRILHVSQAYEKVWGRSCESLYQDPISFVEAIHPEDRERILVDYKVKKPGEPFDHEYRIIRPDGKIRHIWDRGFPIRDPDGQVRRYVGVARDMTDRKTAEERVQESELRYRTLFEGAQDGMAVVDAETGTLVDCNRALCRLVERERAEMMGQPQSILHPPRELIDGLSPSFRDYRESPSGEVREDNLLSRSGKIIPVEIRGAHIQMKGQNYILGVFRDITERKQMEKERSSIEDQLRQAQKMEALGTLAGGIAHDFNNILSAILGYAELSSLDLREGTRARKNLEDSMKAAHRAKDLVEQILAFSRQAKHERNLLHIGPIVKEALKFLRASLPTTIEIREDIDNDLGTIEADPTQIHQVLMNLCTNAAHAMEEKGGVLEVSIGNLDLDQTSALSGEIGAGPYVRLRVSDTGYGMSPAILRRIFDPYFTTKERGKGTGLGLAVVHGIVKSYGGGITVASEVGKGSTFDIYFPRAETAAVPLDVYRTEPLPLGARERVLFVDDEEVLVDIGRETLEHLGYEVTARTSSIEALELFRQRPNRFDVVITDMTMPNMTGDKLAQELLKIRPDIPIILCTGFSEYITEERSKAIGIRELVMKPMAMKELAKTMRKVLDS